MADDVKLANPAVLGLTCFGLTTMLLNLHNVGIIKDFDTTIMGLGFFVGGLAQVIAGIMEFRKGNTFGTTAFLAYGTFWISLVFAVIASGKWGLGTLVHAEGLAWYLLLWGIFTAFMAVGTFKVNRVLQFIFVTLTVLFALLAICNWAEIKAGEGLMIVAGIIGICTGFAALYLAMAENLNEMYGKTILPIWPMGEKEAYKRPEDL
jgi:succinate-acetate transporter protein